MRAYQIIPAFVLGKFISDSAAVLMGNQAVRTFGDLYHGLVTWKSMTGLGVGVLLLFALLAVDWRALLQRKELRLNFQVWK